MVRPARLPLTPVARTLIQFLENARDWKTLIHVVIVVQGNPILPEVVGTFGATAFLTGRLNGWHGDSQDEADDSDDNKQLDQLECAGTAAGVSLRVIGAGLVPALHYSPCQAEQANSRNLKRWPAVD